MPFGIGSLDFIDDAFDSLLGGLDDLFSNKEERQKAKNELRRIKKELKGQTLAHMEKMAEIAAEDRQQARSVQSKSFAKAWWVMPTLALLSFLGFFGVLFALTFYELPAAKQPLYIMLGTLGTIVTQIAQFFFGSSQGSKDKDNRIDKAISNLRGANGGASGGNVTEKTEDTIEATTPDRIDTQAKPAPPEDVGW